MVTTATAPDPGAALPNDRLSAGATRTFLLLGRDPDKGRLLGGGGATEGRQVTEAPPGPAPVGVDDVGPAEDASSSSPEEREEEEKRKVSGRAEVT